MKLVSHPPVAQKAEQPDFKPEGSDSISDGGSTGAEMDKTRRGFLTGLGASAGAVAVAAVSAVPKIEEEVIKVQTFEHELVKVKHFLTHGDGTQDGDRAMLQVDGHYRSHVLRDGKWRMMFPN